MTSIDLFTDTAAILNVFDLGSIMGCPEGMGTIRYTRSVYIRALFGLIFLNVFLEKDCNGKKDRCTVFECNNDRREIYIEVLFLPEKRA